MELLGFLSLETRGSQVHGLKLYQTSHPEQKIWFVVDYAYYLCYVDPAAPSSRWIWKHKGKGDAWPNALGTLVGTPSSWEGEYKAPLAETHKASFSTHALFCSVTHALYHYECADGKSLRVLECLWDKLCSCLSDSWQVSGDLQLRLVNGRVDMNVLSAEAHVAGLTQCWRQPMVSGCDPWPWLLHPPENCLMIQVLAFLTRVSEHH